VGRLFEVVFLKVPSMLVVCYAATVPQAVWHFRLGHVSISPLRSLISSGVSGQVDVSQNNCQACQLAKFHVCPLIIVIQLPKLLLILFIRIFGVYLLTLQWEGHVTL